MTDFRDAGASLIHSGDVPFVNQYGNSVLRPTTIAAPVGASDGTPPPGWGGDPTLSLSAYELNFSSKTGGPNPPAQIVELTNSGTGSLSFSVGVLPTWLVITPMSGDAPASLTVSVLNSGLTAATYGANVIITATGALGSPALLGVHLVVESDSDLPIVDPINKKAWLAYFKTSTFNGEWTTTACTGTANACVVSYGDFGGNPASVDWLTRQRNAANQIAALGGKIFIGAREDEILNMKSQWSQVGGIYTAMEGDTDTVASVEQLIASTRAIITREGLESRIFTTYVDSGRLSSFTRWISGMNWLMLGVYLPYISSSESAESVRGRAAALISTSMSTVTPMIPAGGKVVLAAQAYDRGTPPAQWDATTLTYLQKAYPDALRTYSQIHGIFWFCYERIYPDLFDHGTRGYPSLIPWHKATKQATLGTPSVEVPASGPQGVLTTCNTTVISGTAFDSNYPNQAIQVQIFDGPGVFAQNANRIAQIMTNAVDYSFSFATPASLLDGAVHSVYVYAMSKSSPAYQVLLSGAPQNVQLVGGSPGVTVSGRSFLYKSAPLTWKEATSFMAVKTLLDGGSPWTAMDSALTYWQGKGVNVLRVLGMIGSSGWWSGWTFSPLTPNYYTAWSQLLTRAAAKNILIEACLFADTDQLPPYNTHTGRMGFVTEFITQLGSHTNYTVEIANEPAGNGFADIPGGMSVAQQLAALAQKVKDLNPTRVVTLACAPDNDANTSFNIPPTSYLAIHSDRETKWTWLTDLFDPTNPNVSQSTIPCVDNEPINATSSRSSQVDSDPARWYAYGLASQLRQLSTCFHYGDGTFSYLPSPSTESLLTEWLAGRNAVDWNWGGSYFHGTAPTTGNSPFFSNGQILCLGRSTATTARALIVASPDWTPSLRPGWAATVARKVTDNDSEYAAFYVTLTYTP